MNFLTIFWNLVIESAPWLLLGYLLAGVIKQVIPNEWVHKQLAKPGFVSIHMGVGIKKNRIAPGSYRMFRSIIGHYYVEKPLLVVEKK